MKSEFSSNSKTIIFILFFRKSSSSGSYTSTDSCLHKYERGHYRGMNRQKDQYQTAYRTISYISTTEVTTTAVACLAMESSLKA